MQIKNISDNVSLYNEKRILTEIKDGNTASFSENEVSENEDTSDIEVEEWPASIKS